MFAQNQTASLSLRDYKTIILSILGGALEIYDFVIFLFLSVTIANVFFPPEIPQWLRQLETMAIFSVGYLARPLGGILIAHFSDKIGRKHMFNLTVCFVAIPCLMIGLLPSYAQIGIWSPLLLLLARLIQGAALGGEVPNAWVFVAEHAPKEHRGYSLGLLQAGLTLGYMFAALTTTLITTRYTDQQIQQWAWRIPFIVGGFFGFISVWLRRWLNETPVFLELKQNKKLAKRLPLGEILKHHRQAAIPSAILTAVLASAVIMAIVVTPITLQNEYGLSAGTTFEVSCIAILCLNLGCVIAGKIADWIGPWRTIALYSVLLAFGTTLLTWSLNSSLNVLIICYAIAGLCSGVISAVPAIVVKLFPPAVKVTGISLIYNIAYSVCSAVIPMALLALLHFDHWGMAFYSWLIMLLGLVTVYFYRTIKTYGD
ncbi:MFS transporter [Celerinatantimonas diazotrophica]|uniref:Putative MFS family arabinose efflux permease n=1 Tax=Celerinatantimonas diazotrophica TaxID=412034 RepID=A0A4R1K1R0_9GAMM|nr:MFS transporter [Celerinatantimonas diazotrophica]TCK57840.1 putative MFS family arabinose efflux permease [Celerinatantimonas diazotrophica]CAG9298096.1 Fosfomycin resistance protein AbaF [Celerinatantimonas diazotrophica]